MTQRRVPHLDIAPRFATEHNNLYVRDAVDEVVPRLFVSNMAAAGRPGIIRDRDIRLVVSVVPGVACTHAPCAACLHVPLEDRGRNEDAEALEHYMTRAIETIGAVLARTDGAVLVHCGEGISRAPAVVVAYLMFSHVPRMTYGEATAALVAARPRVNINGVFALLLFNMGEERAALDARARHRGRAGDGV